MIIIIIKIINIMKIQRDDWQQEIMDYKGNFLLAKGRRVGATHIMGEKAVEHLVDNYNPHPTSQIVCSSLTEDQAQLIIAFATLYAHQEYKQYIGTGKDKPTLNRLILKIKGNRRILLARPVGNTGDAVRGFEGQVLMVDEAPRQPKSFWIAAKPILATTGGKIWMWGTFEGQDGYFWDRFSEVYYKHIENPRFKVFHKDTEDVANNRPISDSWTITQKEGLIRFLKEEKIEMTEQEYLQEFMAIASADRKRFYDEDLIIELTTGKTDKPITGRTYLGVDVARMGYDKSSFQVVNEFKDRIRHIFQKITSKTKTPETERTVIEVAEEYKVRKIGIDAGAGTLGVSVVDHLQETNLRKRIVQLNNRSMVMEKGDNPKRQMLLKEDMHLRLLSLMEHRKIVLLDDDDLRDSLRSFQFEYVKEDDGTSRMTISGRNNDPVEGLIRAVHLAIKNKVRNIWIDWI